VSKLNQIKEKTTWKRQNESYNMNRAYLHVMRHAPADKDQLCVSVSTTLDWQVQVSAVAHGKSQQ
jgi:hypothetical protein